MLTWGNSRRPRACSLIQVNCPPATLNMMKAQTANTEGSVRVTRQHTRPARPLLSRSAATRLGKQRVLLPDVDAFTDREDSAEVKQITRDLLDVYTAQVADDEFQ